MAQTVVASATDSSKDPVVGESATTSIWPDSAKGNFVIPFNRAGNLILIKATADTTEGNFILDTGAPGLVLNITYFRNHAQHSADDRGSVSGTVAAAVQTTVQEFTFGGLTFDKLEADMVNLGHLEDNKKVKISGLIGVSFFSGYEMIIDYEKSEIYLHKVNKKQPEANKNSMLEDTKAYSTMPFDIIDNKIIAYAELAGRRLKFFIDTGAESNVLDSRLSNKIFENLTITGRTRIVGAGNKKIEAINGQLKNMKVGNQSLASLPFIVTNLENACVSEVCCIDGMLGFDFLSLHKIGFNFVKRQMYIWK